MLLGTVLLGTVLLGAMPAAAQHYDPMQNVVWMSRSDADRSTFQYDAAGRLLYGRIVQDGVDKWQEYYYDEFDSIYESRNQGDGGWRQWTVDPASNRLVGVDYGYDDAGNLTEVQRVGNAGQPRWELRYDPFLQSDFVEWCLAGQPGCLFDVGGYGRYWALHYGYDADDRRVITVDGNAYTVSYALRDLGGQVLREYSGPIGSTVEHRKDFVHGAGGLVATRERGGVVRYFHQDHLGSPRLITDAGQGVDDCQHFYPYGAQIPQGGFGFDEPTVKFTGHQRDAHGLTDYMMARTCAFSLLRFTSVDPGRDGWNLYSYAASNPIKYVDPDGRAIEVVLDFGFLAYDVIDIVGSLIAGEGVSKTQLAALGADLGATFLPFVTGGGPAVRAAARSEDVTDGLTGLIRGSDEVAESAQRQLPFEDADRLTEVNNTLDRIDSGGPFPHNRDGITFRNREGRLPQGDYREFTVETPGASDRASRRLVVDQDTGRFYYTDDHYNNFVEIDPKRR